MICSQSFTIVFGWPLKRVKLDDFGFLTVIILFHRELLNHFNVKCHHSSLSYFSSNAELEMLRMKTHLTAQDILDCLLLLETHWMNKNIFNQENYTNCSWCPYNAVCLHVNCALFLSHMCSLATLLRLCYKIYIFHSLVAVVWS